MWRTAVLLLLVPLLPSADDVMSSHASEGAEEEFLHAPLKEQKPYGEVKGRDTCSIPCDVTVKLLRDEKHSVCGQLHHSLLAFGRSTRKLMRDVMEEQQRTLDLLSSQVTELMSKVQTLSLEVERSNLETFSSKPVQSHGRDCSDIRDSLAAVVPKIPSGIYIVQPENSDASFEVFCEMDYMGGGWTVMQRRTDGLADFTRPWNHYVDGFGHLAGEHWLGLKKVFHIVNQRAARFQLHVALLSTDDVAAYASYDDFRLDNETLFFRLHLGRYAGGAGDAFRGFDQDQNQDTAPFSCSDVDNDGCNPSCSFSGAAVESCSALHHHTGWWFNQCGLANLNAAAATAAHLNHSGPRMAALWDTWTQNGVPRTIKSVAMKIRRIDSNT